MNDTFTISAEATSLRLDLTELDRLRPRQLEQCSDQVRRRLMSGGADQSIVLRPARPLKNALRRGVGGTAVASAGGVCTRRNGYHCTQTLKATLRLRVANYQWSRGVAFDTNALIEASSTKEGVSRR